MEKYYKFTLNMKKANIIAGILSFIFVVGMFVLVDLEYLSFHGYFILTLYLMYMVLHELLHGLGYMFFAKDKKNIKFGAMLERGVLYAMCQERLNKKQIIISLLMPFVLLSVIVLPIGIFLKNAELVFLSGLNLIGCIGDLSMVNLICKMPKDIYYLDFDAEIGTYLISKKDLSKYGNYLLKYNCSGKYEDSLIAHDIKKVHITYLSLISFIMFLIFDVIMFIGG